MMGDVFSIPEANLKYYANCLFIYMCIKYVKLKGSNNNNTIFY